MKKRKMYYVGKKSKVEELILSKVCADVETATVKFLK